MIKRIFIAVNIKPEKKIKELLNSFQNKLGEDEIKWIKKDNFHLTLKFIGNTTPEKIILIDEILQSISLNNLKFELDIKGVGIFKKHHNSKILWLGISNFNKLHKLYRDIENRLTELGIKKEKQEFIPHLTIGRINKYQQPKLLKNIITSQEDILFQNVKIDEFVLNETISSNYGIYYKSLTKYKLKG